ncbi:MAG TPA: UrcA family protein [Rhizomicrobium sp.]|nr:UrcA family protein [Rhizomicrobium sp.]
MFRFFTAASIFALTVTVAQAAPAIDVQFRDLDLSSPSDARVLEARVHQFADKVCDPLRAYPTSLFYRIWFNNCVRATSVETTRRVEAMAGRYRMFARN